MESFVAYEAAVVQTEQRHEPQPATAPSALKVRSPAKPDPRVAPIVKTLQVAQYLPKR